MFRKNLLLALILLSFSGFSQEWNKNYVTAQKIAQEQNKPIILVFQGSDWCAPCIKLDHELWSTETFKNYAKEHFVMLQADFPRKKKNALPETLASANGKLFETYNKNGIFPLVVVLDSKGNKLGETSYKKSTPQKYIDEINSFLEGVL